MAALNALIEAKNMELASLSSKFDNLQMQQIFFMTTVLSQVGVDVKSLTAQLPTQGEAIGSLFAQHQA